MINESREAESVPPSPQPETKRIKYELQRRIKSLGKPWSELESWVLEGVGHRVVAGDNFSASFEMGESSPFRKTAPGTVT